MNWNKLHSQSQLKEIKEQSFDQPVVIFKHSTRCSISSMALNRIERSWDDSHSGNPKPYFLDLIAHRDISDQVAEIFGVPHQSPQILLIRKGSAVYDASHMGIDYKNLISEISSSPA